MRTLHYPTAWLAALDVATTLAVIMSCATPGFAQTPPGAIPVGSMFLYPALEVAIKRDDNIALQPAATAKSDTIANLRPSARLEAQQGVNIYNLTYRGEYGRYQSQTTDNYQNHLFGANANMTFDARNRLNATLAYTQAVDPRGTLNLVATPTPNRSRLSSVSGLYTYGAEGAQGRIELAGGYADKRYLNNREVTSALDNNTTDYGGTFLWRVQPKTYASFNLKQSKHGYTDPASTISDSTDTFMLVGVRWDATAKTSGRFALGQQKKKFASAGISEFSGTSWEGGVNWKPLTYSSVDYNTARRTSESTGLGNFTVAQTHQVVWSHAWSAQVKSTLTGLYTNDQFTGDSAILRAIGVTREDTTKSVGVRVTYTMRRWLNIGADYTYATRDSNDVNSRYDRNQYTLFVAATL